MSGRYGSVDARYPCDRGTSAPLGAVLLVAVTVVLAAGVTVAATGIPGATFASQSQPPPDIVLEADVDGDTVTLTHRGGDAVDVDRLTVHVTIDGDDLDYQPPVPFFSAAGFRPGPTGAFNPASAGKWRAGESASFRVADTNDPVLERGSRVEISVLVDDRPIVEIATVA